MTLQLVHGFFHLPYYAQAGHARSRACKCGHCHKVCVFERVNVCGTKILVWGKEVKKEEVQAGTNNPSIAESFYFPFCHSKLVHKRSLVHTHIIQYPDHAFMVNISV